MLNKLRAKVTMNKSILTVQIAKKESDFGLLVCVTNLPDAHGCAQKG